MSEEKMNVIEAINEFYRLKDKYESVFYDKYVKPIIKSKKTNKEKRVEYARLPKHECINCKRNVGTIFNISYDNTEILRKFMAKCGDLTNPCPLDIQINYSVREQFDKIINEGLESVEKIKLDIIKQKNNALFFEKGQNIISIFEKLTTNLKKETEQLGYSIEKDILKNDNPERIILLNKSINEFGIGCILPFKQMIQEYMDTNNELLMNQAINFYVNEMIPKLKEIQNIRFAVNIVEYDADDQKYILIQRQNTIESEEECFESDDKVIKFIKGLRKTNTMTKTRKIGEEDILKKNKTKKLKPTLEIVGDEEEEYGNQDGIGDVDGKEGKEGKEEKEASISFPLKFEGNTGEREIVNTDEIANIEEKENYESDGDQIIVKI